MILTNYFIKKKIRSLIEKGTQRDRRFLGLKEANTLLVIYDVKDQEIISVCLKNLHMQHKQIRTLAYGASLQGEDNKFDLSIQPKTDLDYLGFPKDSLCEKFKAIQADILIDLSHSDDYAARYLMLLHPCSFKVGAKSEGQDLYDLSISVTDRADIKQLFGHILFYLQSIRSK